LKNLAKVTQNIHSAAALGKSSGNYSKYHYISFHFIFFQKEAKSDPTSADAKAKRI